MDSGDNTAIMKGMRRSGSAVHVPVVVGAAGVREHVGRDELVQFVGEFIAEKEALATVGGSDDADVSLGAALSQLRRLERELQGLAPEGAR